MLAFLQNAIFYVVPFLLIITLIISIHELGHFWTARACGVAIARFSMGFGPPIVSWRDRGGVEWRIGWLPLGGYVRFAGDENAASLPDQDDLDSLRARIVAREGPGAEKKYLHFKPLWQRALIVAAGPAANFVLAFVLLTILFGSFGEPVTPTLIGGVTKGGPAELAGFKGGDRVVSVDGRRLGSFEDLQFYVRQRDGVPIDVAVERAGREFTIPVTPGARSADTPGGGRETQGLLGVRSGPGSKWVNYNPI